MIKLDETISWGKGNVVGVVKEWAQGHVADAGAKGFTVKKITSPQADRNSPQCPNCTDVIAHDCIESSGIALRGAWKTWVLAIIFTMPQDFHASLKTIVPLSMRSRALTSVQFGQWELLIFFTVFIIDSILGFLYVNNVSIVHINPKKWSPLMS